MFEQAVFSLLTVFSYRKKPYSPNQRSLEIPRRRAVLKAKAMYKNKLEFPGGRGVQNKIPSMGEYGYFLELHNDKLLFQHSIFGMFLCIYR